MGSVINHYKCKQCGGMVTEDYNYKSGETYKACKSCGNTDNCYLKRSEEGNIIYDKEDNVKWLEYVHDGYGTEYLAFKSGNGIFSTYDNPIEQRDIDLFFKELEENKDLVKDKCRLTKWDKEQNKLISLYGELPQTMDELTKKTDGNNI